MEPMNAPALNELSRFERYLGPSDLIPDGRTPDIIRTAISLSSTVDFSNPQVVTCFGIGRFPRYRKFPEIWNIYARFCQYEGRNTATISEKRRVIIPHPVSYDSSVMHDLRNTLNSVWRTANKRVEDFLELERLSGLAKDWAISAIESSPERCHLNFKTDIYWEIAKGLSQAQAPVEYSMRTYKYIAFLDWQELRQTDRVMWRDAEEWKALIRERRFDEMDHAIHQYCGVKDDASLAEITFQ